MNFGIEGRQLDNAQNLHTERAVAPTEWTQASGEQNLRANNRSQASSANQLSNLSNGSYVENWRSQMYRGMY